MWTTRCFAASASGRWRAASRTLLLPFSGAGVKKDRTMPLSRTFYFVVLTVINANHIEMASDLVKVDWSDLRSDPDRADQRSEIQRRRHATDPKSHEAALRALERGRQTQAWSREQILEAIRAFHARVGRPPAYGDFRKQYGLPDYKTVWRRFRSSKVAVAIALGQEAP